MFDNMVDIANWVGKYCMNQQKIQKKYFDDITEMKHYLKFCTTIEKHQRGHRVFKEGQIFDFDFGRRERIVTALAKGSQGNYYEVTLDLERLTGRCDCPSDSYQEKCKHVVAAVYALSDLNYQPDEKVVQGYRDYRQQLKDVKVESHKEIDKARKASPNSDKKKVVKKSPYPQYVAKILKECTVEEQLALLKYLLTTQKVNHAATKVWWQAQHINFKEIEKFVKKQKKTLEEDFFERKTGQVLKEIKDYFTIIFNQLISENDQSEKIFQHYLDLLILLEAELIYDGYRYNELIEIQHQLVTQIINRLEQYPMRMRPLMESALREDQYHILWSKLAQSGGHVAKEILLEQLSLSNSRIPPLFESSEAYQRLILNALVMPLDGVGDNAFFEKVIEECDFISTEKREYFYRLYYKNTGQVEKYLEISMRSPNNQLDLVELHYLLEKEDWEKANILIERALRDPQYWSGVRFQLALLDVVFLKRDLIFKIEGKISQEATEKALEKLYQQVETLDLKEEERAFFFWEELQYEKLSHYIEWYRSQSLIPHNYHFKSSYHKDNVLFYLRSLSRITNEGIDEVFRMALKSELHYLENTQSNVYEFTYELVALVFVRGLYQELWEFIQYCQTHFLRRKKLIEELTQFSDQKSLSKLCLTSVESYGIP